MRRIILILITLAPVSLAAQDLYFPIDKSTDKVTYSTIEEVNKSKEILFKNAQTWVAKSFGDYKSVLQFEDKEAGKLIVKGIADVTSDKNPKIKFTVEIDVKDSKYRAIITDIYLGKAIYTGIYYAEIELMETPKEKLDQHDRLIAALESEYSKLNPKTAKAKNLKKRIEILKTEGKSIENSQMREITLINETINRAIASLKLAMAHDDDF